MNHTEKIQKIRDLIKSGKVKTKGRYEVMPHNEIGWHKNQSAMIVSMASLAELLDIDNHANFIHNHSDSYDFVLRTKVQRNSKLYLCYEDGREEQQQNICRYYPAVEGGKLVKLMPPLDNGEEWRRLGIDTEYSVLTCNNMQDFDWSKLNYDYYITEAQKLIEGVK